MELSQTQLAALILIICILAIVGSPIAYLRYASKANRRVRLATHDEEWQRPDFLELRSRGFQLERLLREPSFSKAVYTLEDEHRKLTARIRLTGLNSAAIETPENRSEDRITISKFKFIRAGETVGQLKHGQIFSRANDELHFGGQTYQLRQKSFKPLEIWKGEELIARVVLAGPTFAAWEKTLIAFAPSVPRDLRSTLAWLSIYRLRPKNFVNHANNIG